MEIVLGHVTEDSIVVSDRTLISILSVSVEALEMCAEAVEALAPWARDLKPDDLLSPLCLMCDFR